MFGREMRLPLDVCLPEPPGDASGKTLSKCVEEHNESIRKTESIARENLRAAQKCQKDYYDSGSFGETFSVGELVWLKKIAIPKGTSRKFFIRWSGPWKIVKVISDITYRIQLVNKGRRGRARKVEHFNQLKKCYLGESREGSQSGVIQSDSANENLDQSSKGASEINQNRGLQSDSEHTNQDQNRVNVGEISDSEEEDLVQAEIQSPAQPARAQRPRMENNPNTSRETRAHRPPGTQRENRDDPNHQAEIIRSGRSDNEQVSEWDNIINLIEDTPNQSRVPDNEEVSAQRRPHLRHTVYAKDDAHNVSVQWPHLTQQQEVDVETGVRQSQDDFTGEAQRPPGDTVVEDEVGQSWDEIIGEAQRPSGNTVVGDEVQQLRDESTGEAQRPPGVAVMEDGQNGLELGAQRPQDVNDVMPRRSSRQKKQPQYLKDYFTEDDDVFD